MIKEVNLVRKLEKERLRSLGGDAIEKRLAVIFSDLENQRDEIKIPLRAGLNALHQRDAAIAFQLRNRILKDVLDGSKDSLSQRDRQAKRRDVGLVLLLE